MLLWLTFVRNASWYCKSFGALRAFIRTLWILGLAVFWGYPMSSFVRHTIANMLALIPLLTIRTVAIGHPPNNRLVNITRRPDDIKRHLRSTIHFTNRIPNNEHPKPRNKSSSANPAQAHTQLKPMQSHKPLSRRAILPIQK